MAAKALPAQDVLHQLLSYDPETGKLFWKERDVDWFNATATRTAEHAAKQWNSAHAGKSAFTARMPHGHFAGRILGTAFLAHRVIWKMVHGTEPAVIDHIDGDGSNNRVSNLRSVTQLENNQNASRRTNNKTGVSGVYWSSPKSKWCACIRVKGHQTHVGYFKQFHEAVAARKAAELEYGFHRNHGRAA